VIGEVTAHLEAYDFDKAARALYDFIWSEYCDWYLELAKVDLYRQPPDPTRRWVIQHTLWTVLEGTMRLLHPVMPHITEEIWQALPHRGESIVVAPWPQARDMAIDEEAEGQMATIMAVVRAIRSLRADLGLLSAAPIAPVLRAESQSRALLESHREYVVTLARAPGLTTDIDGIRRPGTVGTLVAGVEISLEIAEADRARARKRLAGELASIGIDIGRTDSRLADPAFVTRAPAEVVEEERRRIGHLRAREHALAAYLRALA
jgi:valyl-tRNA synthetase